MHTCPHGTARDSSVSTAPRAPSGDQTARAWASSRARWSCRTSGSARSTSAARHDATLPSPGGRRVRCRDRQRPARPRRSARPRDRVPRAASPPFMARFAVRPGGCTTMSGSAERQSATKRAKSALNGNIHAPRTRTPSRSTSGSCASGSAANAGSMTRRNSSAWKVPPMVATRVPRLGLIATGCRRGGATSRSFSTLGQVQDLGME
jgi:hypothetical protein